MLHVLVITTVTTVTATVDAATVAKEAPIEPSLFGAGSSSACGTGPTPGGFSDASSSEFLVGGIRTVVEPDFDLQKVYVPQWSATNGFCLDNGHVCHEMLDEFAPPKFFASVREIEHDQLFTEFNVGAAWQISLSAEVRMREAESAEAICLRAKVSKFEAIEKSLQDEVRILKDHNTTLEKEKNELDLKVSDLEASVKVHRLEISSAELQEKVTVWLLTYGMKLAIVKCLTHRSISLPLERQDELAIGITHSQEGRVLTDVAAFNPSAESNYISALQELQSANFSLLADLQSNKDASLETLMDILRLDETLTDILGLEASQPHVDQLMVPVHHSPDQTVIGARALLLSLDISYSRVQRIRENIVNNGSTLHDVFVSFSEPLSIVALEGTKDDYVVVHADNPESTGADGQAGIGVDVNPLLNVDDAELDISS
uniref:Transposase (Putative), gypsy type n=1 Tax=Tanacetum cinerariifolium TaxID=118510 RepID=A0A6L2NMB2_TANCI|nr:hypothetical protein [Tanacetum cinerariifolium]